MTKYKDYDGSIVFVSPGISSGTVWMSVKLKPGKNGTRRVKSKFLPLRDTAEKAQKDLDNWAASRKLLAIRACRVCGCVDDYACPGGCYWVEEDLCSQCEEEVLNEQQ